MAAAAPAHPDDDSHPAGLVDALLTVSPTGVALLRPCYDEAGTSVLDFAYERLNPAAQQLLRLPEHPRQSPAVAAGVLAFYRDTFATGQVGRYETFFPHDEADGYYYLTAQRSGEHLVVSFADAGSQPRSALEASLRQSRTREQAARAEAEAGRQQFYSVFEQAPAMICIFDGPEHTFQFVNPPYQALVGERPLLGRPIAEAMPELTGQPIFDLLDRVYQTGEPFYATEMLVQLDHHNEGRPELEKRYYNFIYQARRSPAGVIDGILVFANDVTPQVLARQRVQELNEELAAINGELTASNGEFQKTNAALLRTEQQLRQLNEDLEARVQERAGRLAEQQRLLSQILGQVPAAIATLSGPEHRFSFFNDDYQRLVAGRAHLEQRLVDAVPEVVEQGFVALLDEVLRTGKAFVSRAVPAELHDPATGQLVLHYVDLSYQRLVDGQGQATGILAFVVDVTESVLARRQADTLQAALLVQARRQAQQRQELYQVFEQTPVAIVLLREPDHRIDYFNPAFREVFPPDEWAGSSLQGHRVEEVYPRLKTAGLVKLLDSVFTTGAPQTVLDLPLAELQPGSPRYLTLAYQPYREQDKIVGVAAFAYDTTEQVLARQQVQQLNEELAAINGELTAANEELHASNTRLTHTNAELDTFVYTASHDLKSPITNVEGLLLALREELPPAAQQAGLVPQLLELMQAAVQRFQQTLGHLTDVTRLQRDAFDQPAEALDLAGMVEDVRLDILPELTAARATLTLDLDQCPTLHLPAKSLRSILYNLLSNAIKYRDPQRLPQVAVRCRPDAAGQAVLEVQDNGLGLDAQQRQNLFRLFRRLHTHVSGSGVGLYMVKKIVDNLDGTLTVTSEPGVGSTFTVTLPALALPQP